MELFAGRFKDIRGFEQVNRAETVTFEVTGRDVETDEPLNVSWSIEPQEIDVTQADQVVTYTIMSPMRVELIKLNCLPFGFISRGV